MIFPRFAPVGTGEKGNVPRAPDPEDFHRRLQIALIELEKQKARHQRHTGLTRESAVVYVMYMYWVIYIYRCRYFGISFMCTRDREGE